MIVSVKGTWLVHSTFPKYLSLHPWTFVRAMTAIGLLNDDVRKKYDSENLHPNMRSQSKMDALRAPRDNVG